MKIMPSSTLVHRTLSFAALVVFAVPHVGCGDTEESMDSSNEGTSNGGTSNTSTSNGTSTSNSNTTTSNGTTSNGTTSNGTTNAFDDLVIDITPGSGEQQETFEITVEPGDLSVHLSFIGSDRSGDVGILQVRNPQGELVYNLNVSEDDFSLDSEQWVRPAIGTGAAGLLIPPTPAFGNIEGTWQVTAIAPDASLTAMQEVHKRDVGASEQAMDFDFWFAVKDAPLSTMEEQTAFIDVVAENMEPILRPHQMFLGDIKIRDRNAELGSMYGVLDSENLENLCEAAASEEAPGRALRVIVVDVINADGSPCCGGVAPALPGPVLRGDAPPSCVVVSYNAYGTSHAEHAGNFLHEGGHFLGLPHTSEFDGTTFDSFTDTPTCELATYDTNGDGRVDDFECGEEGGANNFLFAGGVADFLPYYISEQQAATMRVHPLFRPR